MIATKELNKSKEFYFLDGYLCLLNDRGEVQWISQETFVSLNLEGILLLTDKPTIIAERRRIHDGVNYDMAQIDYFQEGEVNYAEEILRMMGIPMFLSKGTENVEGAIGFISSFAK